ncbi:MAG: UvrD-helicase domain-containing protein [Crocinitomicaceae bacterium]|nr:UvrD-helicase domain-containing protein [Crocinitomicaceae bacterium]
MATKYLEELNDAQRAAVVHINGPMMVIAGAGSGKTRVLTYRIAYLIDQGIDPFHILALTFTNKAAKEMKERIGKLVGEQEVRNIWMGTFHSIFARILRIENEKINYPRNFSIYDTTDSRSLLKDIIKEMGLDDKIYKPALVHHRISSCKNNLISPDEYRENVEIMNEDRSSGKPRMADIYTSYNLRLFKAGAMDFDDLLFKTNLLLRDHPEVLHRYQHKFRYILVDEYQDTNFSQYLIVKQLAAVNENVCVVGDDAQSIYAFRGANIQNILNFRKDYPEYALYKLEQNYRSTRTIVEAANSIIEKNKDQIKKTVWTSNETGNPIRVHRSVSDNDEGVFVANHIFSIIREEGRDYQDFAILYRTNAQSRAFEEALRKLNIPYVIYGGLSFYQRKEIKDLLAYFRLAANPNDEEALKRIINYPARGIGKTTIEKLVVAAADHQVSIWDTLNNSTGLALNHSTWNKLQEFVAMIRSFAVELEVKNAYDMGHHIASSSGLLKELYTDRTPEGVARYENIQELLNGMKEFSDRTDPEFPEKIHTLSDFLIDVALLTDADNQDENDRNRVSMMTIHGAKGLEFPFVNIVGLEENLFPSQLALNSREELEEERRLFYVALTRAKKQATLSYAMTRYRWGQISYGEMSRFIEELDEKYLELPAPERSTASKSSFAEERSGFASASNNLKTKSTSVKKVIETTPVQPPKNFKKVAAANNPQISGTSVCNNSEEITVGTEVTHEKFGRGKVLTIEGASPDLKATIFFPSSGQKQLLLKFAKLKVLS